jgi:hypothetical protein
MNARAGVCFAPIPTPTKDKPKAKSHDLSFRHLATPLHFTLQPATVSRTLEIKTVHARCCHQAGDRTP